MKKSLTPTAENEDFEISASAEINLKELFGCLNLTYRVAVESCGIVEARLRSNSGILEISRSLEMASAKCTRIAVRAFDPEGDSVLAIFRVSAGARQSLTCEAA